MVQKVPGLSHETYEALVRYEALPGWAADSNGLARRGLVNQHEDGAYYISFKGRCALDAYRTKHGIEVTA